MLTRLISMAHYVNHYCQLRKKSLLKMILNQCDDNNDDIFTFDVTMTMLTIDTQTFLTTHEFMTMIILTIAINTH